MAPSGCTVQASSAAATGTEKVLETHPTPTAAATHLIRRRARMLPLLTTSTARRFVPTPPPEHPEYRAAPVTPWNTLDTNAIRSIVQLHSNAYHPVTIRTVRPLTRRTG